MSDKKKNDDAPKPISFKEKLKKRVLVGLIMLVVMYYLMFSRHLIICGFVFVVQVLLFKEFVAVRYEEVKEEFVLYGKQLLAFVELHHLIPYHKIIAFTAFVLYFVSFVLGLKKGLYKYQVSQFAWVWMVLLNVVGQSIGIYWNTFQGIFWLIYPASMIICNDIWAYFFGVMFGRKFIKRPFIALSPNKTWEGFLGSFAFTMCWASVQVYLYTRVDYWVCPADAMTETVKTCARHAVFLPKLYHVPELLQSLLGETVMVAPVYFHGLVFAAFASLIGPFGGFFASGVKRAFGKKDFNSIFPGHGGVVDRMDCQMIMQLFVWIYLRTFVFKGPSSVEDIIGAVAMLPLADKKKVLETLTNMVAT